MLDFNEHFVSKCCATLVSFWTSQCMALDLVLVMVHLRELQLTEAAYAPPVHAIPTNLTTQQTHRVVYNVHQRRLVILSQDQHPLPIALTVRFKTNNNVYFLADVNFIQQVLAVEVSSTIPTIQLNASNAT